MIALAKRLVTTRRLLAALIALVVSLAWLRLGPLPAGLLDDDERPSTMVFDRNGERLYEARSALGVRGESLRGGALPALVADATVAAEDVRFRWHFGIDPMAIVRATWANLRARRVVQGGSTITQQVAKLLLARQSPRAPRGWGAKLREAVVAIRLEHRLTKTDILALYLSLAPYGNQIQGVERASRAYFGRAAASLTPAEAAFLAALPQQPTRYNPWKDPTGALKRQRHILAVMHARGALSADAVILARGEAIALSRDRSMLVAPHFVERVLAGAGTPRPARVDTSLDAPLQRAVAGIIDANRASLESHNAANVAVAVLDNRSGEWLAWEGSGNYFDRDRGGAIDGVITPRQPGSALKPFTYAAAFERGVHPGRVLADVPSQFPTAEAGVLYSPRNYDGRFRGPLRARDALAGSENVPAVALASEIGVPAVARLLRQAGFSTLDRNAAHYGLGLTLGNAEVRLDEMIAAYAMLARGGERIAPRFVRATGERTVLETASDRQISPRTAFWITDILSDDEARAYVFGRGGSLEFPFAVAAKTGTSQSYHDNWTVGYTREVTVGVWVGNFDRSPLRGSSGVTGAGPIFHDVMMAAMERVRGRAPLGDRTPILAPPPDVHRVELCAESGLLPNDACPRRIAEWAPADHRIDRCDWHHASDRGVITIWPDAFRAWARDAGLLAPAAAVAAIPVTAVTAPSPSRAPMGVSSRGLTIVQPLSGAVYSIDSTLRREFQAVAFEAQGAAPGPLTWIVDGRQVGRVERDARMRWPLVRGTHDVVVKDAEGRSAATTIVVR